MFFSNFPHQYFFKVCDGFISSLWYWYRNYEEKYSFEVMWNNWDFPVVQDSNSAAAGPALGQTAPYSSIDLVSFPHSLLKCLKETQHYWVRITQRSYCSFTSFHKTKRTLLLQGIITALTYSQLLPFSLFYKLPLCCEP